MHTTKYWEANLLTRPRVQTWNVSVANRDPLCTKLSSGTGQMRRDFKLCEYYNFRIDTVVSLM